MPLEAKILPDMCRYAQNGAVYIEIAMETTNVHASLHGRK